MSNNAPLTCWDIMFGKALEHAFGSASKLISSTTGKAFGRYTPLIIESQQDIEKQVKEGFADDYARILDFLKNKQAYNAEFDELLSDSASYAIPRKSWRYAVLMKRSVNVLSKYLYKNPPRRNILGDPASTDFLDRLYRSQNVDSLLQMADRMTYVTDFSAIELYPEFGSDSPLKLRVWDGSEVVPMFSPGDVKNPVAVATLSTHGSSQYIVRIYTAQTIQTYRTEERNAELIESGVNYFGIIPFTFFHYEMPSNCFYSTGIGKALRDLNVHLVRRLTDLADQITSLRPKGYVKNVPPQWIMPPSLRPDEFTTMPNAFNAQGEGPEAEIGWLNPDISFTTLDWQDISNWVDMSLEMLGIPPSAIRMEQQGGTSGVAIQSEQLPLLEEAENRRTPFQKYESDLAKMILTCAGRHSLVTSVDFGVPAEQLMATAMNMEMSFRWPPMTSNRPGPDRDAHDAFLLQNQLKSRTQVLMDNENLTEEEAVELVNRTLIQLSQEEYQISLASLRIQEDQLALQAQYAPPPAPVSQSNGKD